MGDGLNGYSEEEKAQRRSLVDTLVPVTSLEQRWDWLVDRHGTEGKE